MYELVEIALAHGVAADEHESRIRLLLQHLGRGLDEFERALLFVQAADKAEEDVLGLYSPLGANVFAAKGSRISFPRPWILQFMQNWLARILHFLRDGSGHLICQRRLGL